MYRNKELEKRSQLCFHSILSSKSNLLKEQVNQAIVVTSVWETQPWFPQLFHMSIYYNLAFTQKQSHTESTGEETSLESLREQFHLRGIPSKAANLMSHSRKVGTISNYELAWGSLLAGVINEN